MQLSIYTFTTELTAQSAEAIVLVAFGAHFYKDISRGQLESAAKSFGIPKKHEKSDYMAPLAKSLLNNGFIKIYRNADFTSLGRDDIKRVKPF